MDEVVLQKLAAAIYEMLPHAKAEALAVLVLAKWLVEAKWGNQAAEVIPLALAPKPIRAAAEGLNNRPA